MNAKKPPETERFDAAELGVMMREMRENLGYELDAVALELRIRLIYLEAIESGRLSDLPGNAYVSGFLRSYSDFLGLEGDEIVRRFKMAGAEISNQPQLHLRSPVEEGRLPKASILLVAAVIATAAYGGWYYLSDTGKGLTETVSSLPKELAGLVDVTKSQTSPTAVEKRSATPGTMLGTGGAESQTLETGTTETDTSAGAPATAGDASALVSAEPPADTILENSVASVQPAPAPSAASDPAPIETASRSSSKTSSLSGSSVGSAQIVVRATADSYVAVRTGGNQPLFSGLMRRGDSYEVPSGTDLILETGNAGGLQITVGGKRAPSLGPIGEVRRNIPLDAVKLLGGIN